MDKDLEYSFLRKTKVLTQALIVSGTINIGLLSTFFYFALSNEKALLEKEIPQEMAKTASLSNQEVLKSYAKLSFEELMLRLDNKEHVEEGVLKRDLALAALSSMHHLNVEKALSGSSYEVHPMLYRLSEGSDPSPVSLFFGLNDYQFQAIENFVKCEKWPLTDKGLFLHLKHSSSVKEPTLLESFYHSTSFDNIYNLFVKAEVNMNRERLVDILVSGDWKSFEEFGRNIDFSPEKRRELLLKYMLLGSKVAASVLIEIDKEFALKRLEDQQLSRLFDSQEENPKLLEPLAKEVIKSMRSETLRKKAALVLYHLAKEDLPEPYDHVSTLKKFCPELFIKKENAKEAPIKTAIAVVEPTKQTVAVPPALKQEIAIQPKYHTVQDGESLWKIAKRYKVDIEILKKLNHLGSEKLRPGKKLLIPEVKVAGPVQKEQVSKVREQDHYRPH